VALYAARRARIFDATLDQPLDAYLSYQFYDRIRAAHPEFLWRGTFQLQVFSFTAAGPTQSCQPWRVWQVVARYGVLSRIRLPERALKIALIIGGCVAIWRRETVSLAFLVGAAACFLAHPLNMKLWPHHIIPWLPFLCFVALFRLPGW